MNEEEEYQAYLTDFNEKQEYQAYLDSFNTQSQPQTEQPVQAEAPVVQPAFDPQNPSTWVDNRDMTPQRTKMDDVKDLAQGAYQGLTQGATLGFADEMTGGFNAAADAVTALRQGNFGDFDFGDAYTQRRDESRQSLEDARETTPYLTYPSEVLAGGGILGGAMKKVATNPFRVNTGAPGNAKMMTGKARNAFDKSMPGNLVKQGSLGGGLYSAGSSDEQGTDLATDTAIGLGLGATLPVLGMASPLLTAGGAGYASGLGLPLAGARAAMGTKTGKEIMERMSPTLSKKARQLFELEKKAMRKAKDATAQHVGKTIPLIPYTQD